MMARISINHDDFRHFIIHDQKPEDFEKTHIDNINKFRNILDEHFADEEGHFTFEYHINHQQFDFLNGDRQMTEEDIDSIERQYPNCWIFI